MCQLKLQEDLRKYFGYSYSFRPRRTCYPTKSGCNCMFAWQLDLGRVSLGPHGASDVAIVSSMNGQTQQQVSVHSVSDKC